MKQTLTQLIREDIRTTRLVRTLARIEIDASEYMSAKSAAVFHLLKPENTNDKEDLQDEYFMLIERSADQDKIHDQENTESIVFWLSGFTQVRII